VDRARVGGRRVVDLACGEGYGSAELARTAASVVGVDANPDAFEHARLKYPGPKLRFERNMIELWDGDVDCVVFLQTIEHVQDPDAVLARIRDLVGPRGIAYVSTPNVLTLAPEGEERSGNPWHIKEYRAEEFRALCERHFGSVELLGLFHARKLRAHQVAIERLGWDSIHAALRITKPFYDRFTPAISVRDFALRPRASIARWTSSRSCARERPPQHRPAHAHALRGGLRDVAVRRGVAVGGDGDLVPAAARRARRPPRSGSRSR
jgi:SAM-dependent methyltransferase